MADETHEARGASGSHERALAKTPIVFTTDAASESERIADTLRTAGYVVVDVPLAALVARVQVESPNVVLVDADAPGAIDTIAQLRRLPGAGAIDFVYFATGAGTVKDGEDPLASEASAFFTRPVDVAGLVRRLEALTGGPSIRPRVRLSTPPPSFPPPRLGSAPPSRPSTPSLPAPGLRTPGPPLPMSVPSLADLVDPPRSFATFGTVSSELQQLLAEAELRAEVMPHADAPVPTPEEEIETVLPADVLASLDEPIEGDEDEEHEPRAGTGAGHDHGTGHGKPTTAGGSKHTTASGRSTSSTPHTYERRVGSESPARDATPIRSDRPVTAQLDVAPSPPARAERPSTAIADGPRSEGSRWDGPRSEGSRWDGPRSEGSRWDGPRWDEASRTDTPRTDAPRTDTPRMDAPRMDAPRMDTPLWEASRTDASRTDAAHADGPRSEGPRWDVSRADLARPDSVTIATIQLPSPSQSPARGPSEGPARVPVAGVVISRPVDARRFFAEAIARRLSGAICYEHERVVRRLVVRDGDLVTAASGAERESLVFFLGARGELPRDEVERLAGKVPPYGRHAGAALVAHGWLGQDQLWSALRAHAEWIATNVLRLAGGTAQLEAEPPGRLRSEPSVFAASTGAEIFVELVRRAVSPDEAVEALGGDASRIGDGPAQSLLSECALPPAELELVTRARGGTVGDLLARSPDPDIASVVHGLALLGVLDVLPAAEPSRASLVSSVDAETAALDEEALRARIRARLELVDEGDYFSLLGVPRDATSYEVRRAFVELRRTFEPTRILSPRLYDLEGDVRKIVVVLEEAYEILRDVTRRERYRRAIDARPG
ncbi:MAG: hypothetical protein KF894_26660 [Labilithrix sp.]|nr:hypothetical protein [Labilithrix sp.]